MYPVYIRVNSARSIKFAAQFTLNLGVLHAASRA